MNEPQYNTLAAERRKARREAREARADAHEDLLQRRVVVERAAADRCFAGSTVVHRPGAHGNDCSYIRMGVGQLAQLVLGHLVEGGPGELVDHEHRSGPFEVGQGLGAAFTVTEQGTLESSNNTEIKCKVRGFSTVTYVVPAGTVVESGDVLVREGLVPSDVAVGDLLATPVTGAYGHSMGSNYNKITRPPVVFVSGGQVRLVVRRETYDDLMKYVPKAQRLQWHEKAIEAAMGADLHSIIDLLLQTKELDWLAELVRLTKDAGNRLSDVTL